MSRKTRDWERRLFRGFHVAPAAGDDSILLNVETMEEDGNDRGESESGTDKFRRMARLALLNRDRLSRPAKHLSHIGRSNSSESFKSRQSLKKAMDAAKKMVDKTNPSPIPPSPEPTSISDDKLLGAGSTLTVERKASTLSVVAESTSRSVTPVPSDHGNKSTEEADKDLDTEAAGNETPDKGLLIDEPLPQNMTSVKATSPQTKSKPGKRPCPPPPLEAANDGETSPGTKTRELSRVSKSYSDMTDLTETSGDMTKILMENEKRTVDSPKRLPSRLFSKSGSIDINAEMKKENAAIAMASPTQRHHLSRENTLDADSLASTSSTASPSSTASSNRIPFVPLIGENDKVPLVIEPDEQDKIDPPPPSSTSPPAVVVASVSSPAATSTSIMEEPGQSTSTLSVAGKKVDDVKTIKRPKPGGSWF